MHLMKGDTMILNSPLPMKDYLNHTFSCTCGHSHSVPISQITVEDKALLCLPDLLFQNGLNRPFILYDSTTYAIAGRVIEAVLKDKLPYSEYIIDCPEPTPDERTLGEILIHFDPDCDNIIAVGSGTVNDLSRFLSYKLGIPYLIAATAPSMDGFASNVAPLIVKHMKTTYEAHVPYAILGDPSVLSAAPMPMICAGIGDILGKYTCLCDWQISHIITGEYHCIEIEKIVRTSLRTVVEQIEAVKSRDSEAVKNIMEALVLSGIAMSFAGNSRPASGSEHHLSHFWEMSFLFEGKKPVLHGTKVGIATIAVIKAYELLMSEEIDFDKARKLAGDYSFEAWAVKMKDYYGPASDSVIELERRISKNSTKNRIARIDLLEEHWETLRETVEQLPSSDTIFGYLSSLGAPASPMDVGIDKTTFIRSFVAAKELRNRFGLLQILFDLEMTEVVAESVWDYFQ